MATPAGRLILDQNLNIHSTEAPFGGKIDAYRATKKGSLGGRKALNDISNSGKPSALQPSAKHNSVDVVSTGKVLGAGKANFSKAPPEKGKAGGGRKALGDLTNSLTPSVQHLSKKPQGKKLSAIDGEKISSAIKEDAFLHNHHECMKAQRNIMSYGCFMDTVGLDSGSSLVLPESLELKQESPVKRLEMEEMPMILNEDEVAGCWEAEFSVFSSPLSVKPAYENWKDDNFLGFTLIDTPKLQKF